MTLTKKILPLAAILALALPAASASAAPKSKFRFSQPTYVASEGQGTIDVTVTRIPRHGHSRTNQTSSVNWSTTSGSATAGVDYTSTPAEGKLTFTPGVTTQTITFNIAQDTDIETLETIGLKLSAASNNALITTPRTAQVLIADDDGPTQVQLVPGSQSVNESIGNATLYAVRSGATTGTTSVEYATADGTATASSDYTARSGTLSFAIAEFQKAISVPVADDSLPEDPETFDVTLSNVAGAVFANGASTNTATTTIVDNDAAPKFVLDASSYEVNENGSVDVTVQRLSSATAAQVNNNDVFTVTWAAADGTATDPADYIPAADDQLEFDATDDSETITLAANVADTQIALIDDALVEGDEAFGLALAGATGSGSVQPSYDSASSTVVIHDDDTPADDGGNTGGNGGGDIGGSGTGGNDGTNGGNATGDGQVVLGARETGCGLVVKATKKQKLLKQKSLKLTLRTSKACKVAVTTKIKQLRSKSKKRQAQIVRALSFKGKKASLTLQPGKAKTVKVKFTKKTLKAMKKALRAHKKFVATVVVTTRDSASKVSRKTLKITIRR